MLDLDWFIESESRLNLYTVRQLLPLLKNEANPMNGQTIEICNNEQSNTIFQQFYENIFNHLKLRKVVEVSRNRIFSIASLSHFTTNRQYECA